jgi:hypothetical protein
MNPLLAALLFLAVTNIGTGVYAYIERQDVAIANAKLDTANSQLAAAKTANTSNLATIASIRQVNGANAARAMDAQKSATAIAERVTDLSNRLVSAEKSTNQLREKLHASDAKIAAWGNVPVPPTYLDVLRDRWQSVAGGNANGDGDAGPLRPSSG